MEIIKSFLDNFWNERTLPELILAISIAIILHLISPFISYAIIKIFNFNKSKREIRKNAFYLPIKSFFRVLGIYSAIVFLRPTFNFSNSFMDMATKIFKMIVIITTASGLANSINKKSKFLEAIKDKSEKEIDDTSTKFIIRVLRIVIYTIATFMVIVELGYTNVLTGLGLGTIVVTLAAQNVIKDMLGGFMIFIERPYKIGDFIKVKGILGTVEDINFRCTRIRTIEKVLVEVPNAEVTIDVIENYSKMPDRRYDTEIELLLNTDLEKVKSIKGQIIDFLNQSSYVIENTTDVFFTEITSNGLKLRIYCYLNTGDYREYMMLKDMINTEIISIIRRNNVGLAYDTKTIEIKNT